MIEPATPDLDVAIVGAGISGISMAAHMGMMCPGRSFALFERRARIGGTWDLFRYPGVRSDSDMHTLGFAFAPWKARAAIAPGETIRGYLEDVAAQHAIDRRIRFENRVISADWSDVDRMWWLITEHPQRGREEITARFLYLASGYYDYDAAHDAQIPGLERFMGTVAHPQFWPEGLDYAGKRVVVIGSGATAVTMVPAMADTAAHVTMLQRTPTWYISAPAKDRLLPWRRRLLGEKRAYAAQRWLNIRIGRLLFKRARTKPDAVRKMLLKGARKALGPAWDETHFTPPYAPWDQRLCLVPDGDLFAAIRSGKASVVTDRIETVEEQGIRLASGGFIEADVIVTATGLKLAIGGKIALTRNGAPIELAQHYYYRGCLFSNLPNLAAVFGYLNASWTLRADMDARYVCELLNEMAARGAARVQPRMKPGEEPAEDNVFDFSSGYIERSRHLTPKSAASLPWRLSQDYVADMKWMAANPVDDGIVEFS